MWEQPLQMYLKNKSYGEFVEIFARLVIVLH
jgi:hypothetical protein